MVWIMAENPFIHDVWYLPAHPQKLNSWYFLFPSFYRRKKLKNVSKILYMLITLDPTSFMSFFNLYPFIYSTQLYGASGKNHFVIYFIYILPSIFLTICIDSLLTVCNYCHFFYFYQHKLLYNINTIHFYLDVDLAWEEGDLLLFFYL